MGTGLKAPIISLVVAVGVVVTAAGIASVLAQEGDDSTLQVRDEPTPTRPFQDHLDPTAIPTPTFPARVPVDPEKFPPTPRATPKALTREPRPAIPDASSIKLSADKYTVTGPDGCVWNEVRRVTKDHAPEEVALVTSCSDSMGIAFIPETGEMLVFMD